LTSLIFLFQFVLLEIFAWTIGVSTQTFASPDQLRIKMGIILIGLFLTPVRIRRRPNQSGNRIFNLSLSIVHTTQSAVYYTNF